MTQFSKFSFQAGVIIGKRGENLARGIYMDVSDWITQYGAGSFSIIHQRSADSYPYIVTPTLTDGKLYWAFSNIDTAYAGRGRAEVRYTVESTLAKSVTFETMVSDCLENPGTAPDPYTSWLNTLTGLANTTTENASAAAASASSASSSASSAASSASSASTKASEASASATAAAGSATAAEAAQTGAETAEANAKEWAKNSPYIGQNGHWFVYSAEHEDFVDSGVNATGPQGATGATGPQGQQGPAGEGVPSGGTEGQIMKKTSSGTEWGDEQDISGLQPKTDNTLATTNKTVIGAINELKGDIGYMKAYVTPEMFGAAGDGVTDDTVAVRAVLESAYLNVVMKGSYYVTGGFNITNNKNISGGGKLVCPSFDTSTTLLYFTCQNAAVANIHFESVRDNNHVDPPAGHTRDSGCLVSNIWFIRTNNVESLSVEQVTFLNSEYDCFIVNCDRFIIRDFISTNASCNMYFSGCESITVKDGIAKLYTLLGEGDHNIYLCHGNGETVIDNVHIQYASSVSNCYPIHSYASSEQIAIDGVTKSVTVTNCHIEYTKSCFATMVRDMFLVSNCLLDGKDYGDNKLFFSGNESRNAFLCIRDCVIKISVSNPRILFNNALQVANVLLDNCRMSGITIQLQDTTGSAIRLKNCQFKNINCVVDTFASSLEVERCVISGEATYAVYLKTAGNGVTIKDSHLVSGGDGLVSLRKNGDELLLLRCTGNKSGASSYLEYNGDYHPSIKAAYCYFPTVRIRTSDVSNTNSVFAT